MGDAVNIESYNALAPKNIPYSNDNIEQVLGSGVIILSVSGVRLVENL